MAVAEAAGAAEEEDGQWAAVAEVEAVTVPSMAAAGLLPADPLPMTGQPGSLPVPAT